MHSVRKVVEAQSQSIRRMAERTCTVCVAVACAERCTLRRMRDGGDLCLRAAVRTVRSVQCQHLAAISCLDAATHHRTECFSN